MNEELIEIGYTQKPHGVNGELKFYVEENFFEDVEYLKVIFLNIKGNNLPYFIEHVRGADYQIIKFEDINSKEAASPLSFSTAYARKQDLNWSADALAELEELFYNHCVGYRMIDIHDGDLGIIKEIIEYPQQELAVIEVNGKEFLLPLNERTVQKMDNEKKELMVEMPEGLFDLEEE
jgi:16S rRNA processing protein RimM